MQKLKAANLYQSELLPVSGKLVERYNQCLKTLGFSPTELTSFSIDGIGWSPEIAEEKKELLYLNHAKPMRMPLLFHRCKKENLSICLHIRLTGN